MAEGLPDDSLYFVSSRESAFVCRLREADFPRKPMKTMPCSEPRGLPPGSVSRALS